MATVFSGIEGKIVPLDEIISGFEGLLGGAGDEYPD